MSEIKCVLVERIECNHLGWETCCKIECNELIYIGFYYFNTHVKGCKSQSYTEEKLQNLYTNHEVNYSYMTCSKGNKISKALILVDVKASYILTLSKVSSKAIYPAKPYLKAT